ncbi:carbohydrate-binding module family 20 domain-containing protein [Streptomyces sp. NPDC001340]
MGRERRHEGCGERGDSDGRDPSDVGGSARRGRRPSRYHRRELLAITALLGPTPRDRTAAERFTARPLKSIARSFSVNLDVPFSTSPRSRVVELCPFSRSSFRSRTYASKLKSAFQGNVGGPAVVRRLPGLVGRGGSLPSLGSWNTSDAIPLSSASYPTWSKLVIVPRSTSFAYKYVKKDGSGNETWESGQNRSYTTGSSSGYTTGDTWKLCPGFSSSTCRRRARAPCSSPRWR